VNSPGLGNGPAALLFADYTVMNHRFLQNIWFLLIGWIPVNSSRSM